MQNLLCLVLLICFDTGVGISQQPIHLQGAIDTALKNNLTMRNEMLYSEYLEKLQATAFDIPQTTLAGEYGQFNSAFYDNKWGIAQGISFPTVYLKQKSLLEETYKSGVMHLALKEVELKQQVSSVFYRLIYLDAKQQILIEADSAYVSFLEQANLRFEKGETNILEKTTAEMLRGQIHLQLQHIQQEIEILRLQFQLLLNADTPYYPATEGLKMPYRTGPDTSALAYHPAVQLLQQEKTMAVLNTQLEKSRLLPDLSVAFNSMSQQGMGADDIYYPKSERFGSVQFGVGIPLFFGAQKAKIRSAKTLEQISENNLAIGLQSLKTDCASALSNYNNQLAIVQYFEETALRNADTIVQTATRQFENGDINYLEWTMLINNAITIRSDYLDAVNALNQSIIQLEYFSNSR